MKASISTNTVTNEVTSTIQGLNWEDLQQASFYESEVQVRELLKLIGQEVALTLLRSKAVETPTLEWEGTTYYRKAASHPRTWGAESSKVRYEVRIGVRVWDSRNASGRSGRQRTKELVSG